MRFPPNAKALTVATLCSAASCAALTAPAWAAPKEAAKSAATATPSGGTPSGGTIVATVNGDPIRMADVAAAAQQIPQQMQGQIPPEKLFPLLIDQLVNGRAVQIQARKQGLDKDPAIAHQMQSAADQVLQSAALQRAVFPQVTEDAIKAQYDKQYAGKPGEEEVHARHILVDSEAKAKDIIRQLEAGAKFEDLSKKFGDPKDPSSQQGGDLGFFKKGDMLPEFSNVAFTLKPNEYTKTPVHTRYGWHVIQVLETKVSQPPTYDQVHDEIKQQLLRADAKAFVQQARAQVKVQLFNANGTPVKPGGTPALPPAPPAATH
jgi:peptidyl-prolyl cis-trans isomerase C